MIGSVIVTHGRLGAELLNTAEFILGRIELIKIVSIDGQGSPDEMHTQIQKAIKSVDQGQGVLILTDMFGGTPSNLSLSFLAVGEVEVLTGVNLPMIIKLVQFREKMSLMELAQAIGSYGKKSINVAGEILSRRAKT
ncbi:MAG: PTS sugar transporter subunit IIA [Deltaproteobacteria bacterium]|nr:PTS sugar transporter subunit IIA [Deltaproteobacteria bacterium]